VLVGRFWRAGRSACLLTRLIVRPRTKACTVFHAALDFGSAAERSSPMQKDGWFFVNRELLTDFD
jgi:hypothetical protein